MPGTGRCIHDRERYLSIREIDPVAVHRLRRLHYGLQARFLPALSALTAPVPKDSHTTLWTFLAGLVMFFFVGLPLAATGITALVGLGSVFVIIGLITIFAAFKMNGDNEKRKRQGQAVARQMAKMYPQGFYPPQQIVIQAPPTSTHTEVTREIVKVRCKHCNALNYETANYCTNCKASL